MNQTIKSLWVTALKSGDYVQGDGALHIVGSGDPDVDRFCCLGVLCDLAFRAGVVERVEREVVGGNNVYTYRAENSDSQRAFLPQAVMAWAGLDDDIPLVPYRGEPVKRTLSSLNDWGTDFTEIADLIEAHL